MFLLIRNRIDQIVYAIRADQIKDVYATSSRDSAGKYFYETVIIAYKDDKTENYEHPFDLEDLMSQIAKLGV